MSFMDDAKAFVDGELEVMRAAEIERAMETDADLREEINAMKALGFELKRTAVAHPAKGAEKALEGFRRRPLLYRIPVPLVAATCLVVASLSAIPLIAQEREAAKQSVMPEIAASITTRSGKGIGGAQDSDGSEGMAYRGGESTNGATESPTFGIDNLKPPRSLDESKAPMAGFSINPGETSTPKGGSPDLKVLSPDLIRTASMSVKVTSAKQALEKAITLSKTMGGFYQSSQHSAGENQNPVAQVTLRVPVNMFDTTLTSLREFGEVVDEHSDSQDVTVQIADVGARLKVLRAEEESYVTMLRAGRKIGEILEIKDRLSTVRQEIESLTAQLKTLKNQSSYSTIACSFSERPRVKVEEPPKEWSDDTWANAVNGLKSVGRSLGQAAIFIFVFAPVWLPIAFLGWFLVRRSRVA